ncbi:carboxypeptidase-like regulatory domain-containing protein [Aquimarina sp. D1M17]|uniref:carboxypeptidase-like regulatory domain-containing protein n=1 Tax=Aquimarina acroporae TaxID=2937283 RepID=UPI0020BF06FF|nr:carboxypeptidase-like regulatory domain-containing protein [Aquimarina acroporae]MCK8523943.1 carboxypeptidase-like regulatory domain-containing protein [Aquimarina acroporae]
MSRILQLLLFLIWFQTFGQSEMLRGRIVASSIEGFAINIVNYSNNRGTTNDERGYFEIPAKVGDTVVFSSVQYQKVSYVVAKDDLEKTVRITLNDKTLLLDQVQISNIELSGNLDNDVGKVELKPFVDNRTLGLPFSDRPQPTLIERRIYTARSGILDLPINYLNGKLKKLKRIKALKDLDRLIEKGETTFNTTFFTNSLGIPEDFITDFMYYCAEDDYFKDLLENSKRLSLVEFFAQKAISYRAYKEID